jgi:hypothetical protein
MTKVTRVITSRSNMLVTTRASTSEKALALGGRVIGRLVEKGSFIGKKPVWAGR